jgi:anion transporter
VRAGRRLDARRAGALLGLLCLALGWVLPPAAGLTPSAQRTLGLILFTIAWTGCGVLPEGLVSLFFVVIAIAGKLAAPQEVLQGWTDPTLWFNVAAFGLGHAFVQTGFGKRCALLLVARTGCRYGALVGALFAVNAVFSFCGLSSIARIAILLPAVTGIASTLGLRPGDIAYRGLVMAVVGSSTAGGLLVLSGAGVNPVAMSLAGVEMLYSRWLLLFAPVVAAAMVLLALGVAWWWRPGGAVRVVGREVFREQLTQLGPLGAAERRLLLLLGLAIVLWNLDFWHGLNPGWIALLAAALLATPGIGVMSFDEFLRVCQWNVLFFIAAMLGISRLIAITGLGGWLGDGFGAIPLPDSPVGFLLGVGLAVILFHIPLGTSLSAMTVLVPAAASYGARAGVVPCARAPLGPVLLPLSACGLSLRPLPTGFPAYGLAPLWRAVRPSGAGGCGVGRRTLLEAGGCAALNRAGVLDHDAATAFLDHALPCQLRQRQGDGHPATA